MCKLVSTRIRSKILLQQLLILKFSLKFSVSEQILNTALRSLKPNLKRTMIIGK